jgi:cytochrome c oxidase cbb3-type subunit 3
MIKKQMPLYAFIGLTSSLNAQTTAPAPQFEPIAFSTILMAINIVLLLFVLLLVNLLLKSVRRLKRGVLADELSWWDKFAGVKTSKTEAELALDEDFDGIVELDNPTPPWFNFLFYSTIIFGVIYMFNYHYFKIGKLQDEEFKEQVEIAEAAKQDYLKSVGNLIDENSVTLLSDIKALTNGATLFKEKCAVCHGEKAEGKVGPNLTDEFWIHGGSIQDIFKTIKYGVPAKGMVSWQNSLNGQQMQELASFIKSLQGSKPANPKEPQGDKYTEATAAAATLSDRLTTVQ